MMIEHDVGVSTVSMCPVKKIDTDYLMKASKRLHRIAYLPVSRSIMSDTN